MLTRFEEQLSKLVPQYGQKTFLLAVSGGLDSMVMLDLFRRLNQRFVVAHVNFQLRGIESGNDEHFVRSYCEKWGINCCSRRVETNNYATTAGLSVQMAARELRYKYFHELIAEGRADLVATAHHLNDQIETILMGLVRGGGAEVLAGIPAINGTIVRPLLFATRAELETYAADHQVTWREDESNQSDQYVRNVLRRNVIPVLKSIKPALEKAFTRSTAKAKAQLALYNDALKRWRALHVVEATDETRISSQGLSAFAEPVALLFDVIESFGFNYDQAVDIIRCLDGEPGKVFYSSTHRLLVDREYLIIQGERVLPGSVKIAGDEHAVSLGDRLLTITRPGKVSISRDPAVACVDARKLRFPLEWRRWRAGDSFQPLGMQGRKKVSDMLIDLKIPVSEKEKVTVIQSGEDIVWLVGIRIDDRYRVTEGSDDVLMMEVR